MVVGGMAVNLQGVQRATADLNIAIALDAVSLRRAVTALGTLGLRPILPVQLEQIMDPAVVQSWIDEKNLRAIAFHHPSNPAAENGYPSSPGRVRRRSPSKDSGGRGQ